MKILVTGGAGFIGTNLIKRLLDDGHEVVSWDNYSTGLRSNHIDGATYTTLDITKLPIKSKTFLSKFDVVYHLAAIARIQPSYDNPINYFKTNTTATMNMARMCVEQNIPLIYAGSSSHHAGLYSNPYTFSKSTGEDVLEMFKYNFGLKYAIARFYNVYGPHQLTEGGYTTLIGRWMNNIENGLPCEIYGDGDQRRDFTHVDDIVDALIKILIKKKYWGNNAFELGRGENVSVNEVATMFGIVPEYKSPKPGEARNTLCDTTLAEEDLKWHPKLNLSDYIMAWAKSKAVKV